MENEKIPSGVAPRFLTLRDVAAYLTVSETQALLGEVIGCLTAPREEIREATDLYDVCLVEISQPCAFASAYGAHRPVRLGRFHRLWMPTAAVLLHGFPGSNTSQIDRGVAAGSDQVL
jgi:hypothetical protein